ncbi:hypothetical protein [Novosphingobium pentaromativorans]|uniref:hypothetical protein n=1 Tax=Novosphingobium pentaromativorans TaxID=205844 RepID=UPI000A7CFA31|nr:hypothetical protein [Novosphingobium pentaromativorans]
MGDTFNQSNVHGDNIINLGRQPFQLTQGFLEQIAGELNKAQLVNLKTAGKDKDKVEMGKSVAGYLAAQGFKVAHKHAYDLINIPPLPKPLYIAGNNVTFDPT